MKRIFLLSSVATAVLLPLSANAETKAGVLYIPADTVALTPSGTDVCNSVSMSDYNAGLGCVPNLTEARDEPAHPDAATLADDVALALDAYDVHVTTTRPPEYLPYFMLLPSDDEIPDGLSQSCTGAPSVCAGRGRDLIGFTNGGTMLCQGPDTLQTMLFAFGRMSGLEGCDDATDAMHYPPDFMTPAAAFTDACVTLVPPFGGEDGTTVLPLDCTSVDHEGGECMAGEQNAHQDLLAYFGARGEDMDAPVITVNSPADGDMIDEGGALNISMTVADDSTHVGVMIKIESPSLDIISEGMPALADGSLSACTSSWCDSDYLDGDPFRENDGPWTLDVPGLPGGEYTITLGAADYHGNVADEIVLVVTIGGEIPMESDTAATTDSDTDGTDTDATATASGTATASTTAGTTAATTFVTDSNASTAGETDDSDTDTAGEMNEDDSGCACTAGEGAGGAMALFLGLFGFGLARRRD